MKKILLIILSFLAVVYSSNSAAANLASQDSSTVIGSAAVWSPGGSTLQAIQRDCGLVNANDLGNCFTSEMRKYGASDAAVKFSNMLDGVGYMVKYRQTGKLGVAYAYFPFTDQFKYGCFIVNGKPGLIDIDDTTYISSKELNSDKTYSEIKKHYPRVSVWPGERTNYDSPEFQKGKNGSQKLIVSYRLRNGCDQCMLLGYLKLAFRFDSTGKFLSTQIAGVTNTTIDANRSVNSWVVKNIFGDPSKPVNVDAGEKFVIVLPSNHSAGYKWQLADQLDATYLKLIGTDYRKPYESLPGAPGKETWTFEAGQSGSTEINFEYAPAWQSSGATKKVTFKVNIN